MSLKVSSPDVSTVVFDLGNVVLGFDHWIVCRRLSEKYGIAADTVFECIFTRGLENAFDRGRLSPEAFTQECSNALGVQLNADFKAIWSDIFWENPEVIDIIRKLKSSVRLILLSNTNTWHIEHVRKRYSVLDLFDALVLSFEVGQTKPHPSVFDRAIKLSQEPQNPSRTAFIDDKQEYAQAARKLGLRDIHFVGADQLQQELRNFLLL